MQIWDRDLPEMMIGRVTNRMGGPHCFASPLCLLTKR